MSKKPINPKEKRRLAAIMKAISRYSDDTEEHRAARNRIQQKYLQEDILRERNCRSAISKRCVPIAFENNILEYYPSTGELLYAGVTAGYKEGMSATKVRKDGVHYLHLRDGGTVATARVIHEAIHGPIPDDHGVYCVDNDPGNLTIRNLRTYRMNRKLIASEIAERERAKELLKRIREERKAS